SFPMDLLLETHEGFPPAKVSTIAPAAATADGIDRAAEILADARKPLIVSGDGVGHAGAWAEITALAEAIGATIHTEGYSTLWNCPQDHPLFGGPMPNLATQMRATFDDVDAVVLCGVTSQAPVSRYDDGGPLVPWRVRTVAIDDNPWDVGKNQPVEVGLIGDV